jgi:hypothetical protein
LQNQDVPYKVLQKSNCTATFYLKDCITGLKENVKDKSADVVVTSPPYNIGTSYSSYKDELPREKYLTWIEDIGVAIKHVLTDDGSFFLNIGNKPKDPWIAWDVAYALRKYFVLQNVIHWVKSIAINKAQVGNYPNISGDIAVGHFKPIVSTLQSMAMCTSTSWLSGYHIRIRQILSAGRQPTRKTDVTEAIFGSYLIKLYKVEVGSVRTQQHFLSSSQICASGCMAAQN